MSEAATGNENCVFKFEFTNAVDDNQLVSMPFSMGGMLSLQELTVSANDLEEIPPSIGLLRHLRFVVWRS